MARRDSGKKVAKGGKSLRAVGKRSSKSDGSVPPSNPKALPKIESVRSSENSKSPSKKIPGSEWPTKRDVLYKPERSKYVRKQLNIEGCVFCDALKRFGSGRESLVLHRDDLVMVIMNKYPYNNGHLLVLPVRHEGELQELSHEEVQAVFLMVQRCVTILQDAYKPSGFNVGLNLGAAAGAGIPEHLHSHVIPRWSGDTNFFPLIAHTKVVVETLEQTYDRLIGYFKS